MTEETTVASKQQPKATEKGGPSPAIGLIDPALLNGNDALGPEERESEEERAEGDIMEEALALLNDSRRHWVNGDMENALDTLDMAYAILLDVNGDPDVARQKDDLRLMISKQILSIYNSLPGNAAKGLHSEIPLISNADVEREIRRFQTVEREFFISSYQRSALYRPMILKELQKEGLPEELSWLPLVESGFKVVALSKARALGLWQFIPSTGHKYGMNRDEWIDERMDIEKSTRGAINYLKDLHGMFGDWLTVLAAYNCGEGRVMRTIAQQHINYLDHFWDLYRQLPNETARYVPRFLATMMIVNDPEKYGMDDLGPLKASGLEFEMLGIDKSVRLQDLSKKTGISEELFNILNAELRHRITPNRPYQLRVPKGMANLVLEVIDEIPVAARPRELQVATGGSIVRHQVRQGETLSSIARRYNTSVSAIQSANRLGKNGMLRVGQTLSIPVKKAAATRPAETKTAGGIYTVRSGDTLFSIAQRHGLSVAALSKINGLQSDQLRVGQTLRLEAAPPAPAAAKQQYTVKKGDTLAGIARANNISLAQLLKINNLSSTAKIFPGQVLRVR